MIRAAVTVSYARRSGRTSQPRINFEEFGLNADQHHGGCSRASCYRPMSTGGGQRTRLTLFQSKTNRRDILGADVHFAVPGRTAAVVRRSEVPPHHGRGVLGAGVASSGISASQYFPAKSVHDDTSSSPPRRSLMPATRASENIFHRVRVSCRESVMTYRRPSARQRLPRGPTRCSCRGSFPRAHPRKRSVSSTEVPSRRPARATGRSPHGVRAGQAPPARWLAGRSGVVRQHRHRAVHEPGYEHLRAAPSATAALRGKRPGVRPRKVGPLTCSSTGSTAGCYISCPALSPKVQSLDPSQFSDQVIRPLRLLP